MTIPKPENDYERSIVANVEGYGWHCTSVRPSKGDDSPPYTYTVGLHHSYGQPEFIVFGLSSDVAHDILSLLASAAQAGEMYPLDTPCGEIIDGFECAFVAVPRSLYREYVYSALWFYANEDFPLYQLVWPDADGRYPWNQGYRHDPKHPQPVLAHIE